MNLFSPVSSIMSTKLLTISPEDNLETIKEIFDNHRIHHIPVVHIRKLVGMISKLDYAYSLGGKLENDGQNQLGNIKAKDIMTTMLGRIEPEDRINVAIEVFNTNQFHALPVVSGDELVGIVTTFDIIRALSEDKPKHPEDVYTEPLNS